MISWKCLLLRFQFKLGSKKKSQEVKSSDYEEGENSYLRYWQNLTDTESCLSRRIVVVENQSLKFHHFWCLQARPLRVICELEGEILVSLSCSGEFWVYNPCGIKTNRSTSSWSEKLYMKEKNRVTFVCLNVVLFLNNIRNLRTYGQLRLWRKIWIIFVSFLPITGLCEHSFDPW